MLPPNFSLNASCESCCAGLSAQLRKLLVIGSIGEEHQLISLIQSFSEQRFKE